ncbi:MAG TPA: metal ABC transporter permease, partial [Armatimonadota bacterium]|nr:metal ABC transporter permease [Armatimonadota bacterium]
MLHDLFSPFMLTSYLASALVGTACGFLSVYVILKRLVFLAVALAQLVSAAVALAFFLHLNPTVAALGGVVLGALLFSWPALGSVLPRENAIGTSYALASAAGVLLIAKNAQGEEHLLNLLYGSVLTVPPGELWVMGGVVILAGAVYLRYAKEFLFTSFDPEMARTLGVRTRLWEAVLYVSLGLVIALAIHLGGIMLVFALLVMPGYAVLLARSR